jgi:hypothetical protein
MEVFEEALDAIIRKGSRSRTTVVGKVKNISGDTCTLERKGLPDLEDVRLNAVSGDFEDVFIVFPKVGSEVLVLQVENAPEESCIVKYTEIEKVLITIGGAKLELSGGKVELKNNTADLKKILKDTFTQLKSAIIQTPSGPGSFSAPDKMKFDELKSSVGDLFK